MKKAFAFPIVLLLFATLAIAGNADTSVDNWQIGTPNGDVFPSIGAGEFLTNGAWYERFSYTIGTDADPISSPFMPGYIGPDNVCFFNNMVPCTDTAENLDINFELVCNYISGGLQLIYDRYGSEGDNLYFDGDLFATISATEVGFRQFSFDLIAEPGPHTITIEYAGGGTGNGHFIDYLRLESMCKQVSIDIKPGSYPSCFNNNGRGVIPVAIFGSSDFDVHTIKIDSIRLEELEVATTGKTDKYLAAYEDINHDGFMDLVIKFKDVIASFPVGSSYANLTAELMDGTPIFGTGDICLSPYTYR